MSRQNIFIALAALVGLASGPWALDAAAASNPPMDWGMLAFMAGGIALAIPAVLGFQFAANKGKGFAQGWALFVPATTYFVGAGLGTLAISVWRSDLGPHAFLFAALGVAMLIGLAITRALFASRFTDAR
jgi:hypothetical protein